MKIKTSDLIGAQLDWAVAKAEGLDPQTYFYRHGGYWVVPIVMDGYNPEGKSYWFSPSTTWSQVGPMIDRERIDFSCFKDHVLATTFRNVARGDTYLIAACRALVTDKLGEEIEVPEELA